MVQSIGAISNSDDEKKCFPTSFMPVQTFEAFNLVDLREEPQSQKND
jgi:hypothetical protein